MKPDHDRDSWRTPPRLFHFLNERFRFTLDAAASKENALLPRYYTKEDDALSRSWKGQRVFCNPPYSRAGEFALKALHENKENGVDSLLLVPVRCDRLWWHKLLVSDELVRIEFYCGRLCFSGTTASAFMYNANLIFGFFSAPHFVSLDASKFNENGKGKAKT